MVRRVQLSPFSPKHATRSASFARITQAGS
jgi:hypothetical protein